MQQAVPQLPGSVLGCSEVGNSELPVPAGRDHSNARAL